MEQQASYGVQIEIRPYPLKNQQMQSKWEKILSEVNKIYRNAKISKLPNYFWFTTELDAIEFIKQCWTLQLHDSNFNIQDSIQFPTSLKKDEGNQREWVKIEPSTLFLLTTPYKDEFTAGILAPFQCKNIDNFTMEQDVWNLQMIDQLEKRNGKQWLNSLDESDHKVHQGTFKGEFVFYIDRQYWSNPVEENFAGVDEYIQIKDIADGDRYTFTKVRAVGLST